MGKNWSSSVTGSSNDYFQQAGNWTPGFRAGVHSSGRALRCGGVFVGETVRNKLFGRGESCRQRDSSETVLVRRHRSAEIKGTGTRRRSGSDGTTVIVPLKTLQRRVLSGREDISSLMVAAADVQPPPSAFEGERRSSRRRQRRHVGEGEEDNFNVLDTKEIAQTMTGATRTPTMLLGAVAAVRARAKTSCSEALIRVR